MLYNTPRSIAEGALVFYMYLYTCKKLEHLRTLAVEAPVISQFVDRDGSLMLQHENNSLKVLFC